MVISGSGSSDSCEVLVIGSGAGGAVTAALLAEAGRDVLLVEEGPWYDPDTCEPFSLEEMRTRYRNGGPVAALGRPPVAYVEGRCVGGSTEVNSGLYHRPPAETVAAWGERYRILDCEPHVLDAFAADIERTLTVSTLPGPPPAASAALERGASKLGWRAMEVPRVFRYDDASSSRGVKQTMSRTFVPRAVAAGTRVVPDRRVERILMRGRRAVGALATARRDDGSHERITIDADHVFICSGAIQTPTILQRSGIRRNVGTRLRLHPTVKLAARFAAPVDDHLDVPMHQVREFAPDITFGGSVSRRGYVALALGDTWERNAARMEQWERIAIYYAAIRSEGAGRVVALPGLPSPVVTYRLTEGDLSRLARGLVHLGELLFAAGAVELYPSIAGAPPLTRLGDLAMLWDLMSRRDVNLMTIHLFSSVGMGENYRLTGADSYGRVWGMDNLRINDASLLPDAPGVNPQGMVMALAARNCAHFLATTQGR
jgi:choline dehydrogenase-like flavoprotein